MNRLALALALLALLAPAVAQADQADQIEVTARAVAVKTTAFPPAGRAGDADYGRWVVRDRFGRSIGDMLLDCRWVVPDLRLCVGQVTLPLGAIAVLGASRTRYLGAFSVVGGTGEYVGAAGTLTFKAVGVGRYVMSVNYRKD